MLKKRRFLIKKYRSLNFLLKKTCLLRKKALFLLLNKQKKPEYVFKNYCIFSYFQLHFTTQNSPPCNYAE